MGQIAPSKLISNRSWRVALETLIETEGPSGAPIVDWVVFGHLFVERIGINAAERYTGDQVSAREYTRWTMAYEPALDPDLIDWPKTVRLRYGARAYNVQTARRAGTQGAFIELTTLASSSVVQPQR